MEKTKLSCPDEAVARVFGNLSGGPAGIIKGRIIRIITARISGIPGAAPRFSIEQAIDRAMALLLGTRKSRIFEIQYEK